MLLFQILLQLCVFLRMLQRDVATHGKSQYMTYNPEAVLS